MKKKRRKQLQISLDRVDRKLDRQAEVFGNDLLILFFTVVIASAINMIFTITQ